LPFTPDTAEHGFLPGAVIVALASAGKSGKPTFVPFRNSKLTRVLQESLGGNSLTVMVQAIYIYTYIYVYI